MIASSIMSKKIAEGTDALVLDVKVGSGAFMTDVDRARTLARTMVDLGDAHGVRCAGAADRHGHAARVHAPATPSRSRSRSRFWPGVVRADVVELTVALARAMLELAEVSAVRSRRRRSPTGGRWTCGGR